MEKQRRHWDGKDRHGNRTQEMDWRETKGGRRGGKEGRKDENNRKFLPHMQNFRIGFKCPTLTACLTFLSHYNAPQCKRPFLNQKVKMWICLDSVLQIH